MKIEVPYKYYESYLPTPRHRKLRWREVGNIITVEILEINIEDAPVVFQVKDYDSLYRKKNPNIYSYNNNLYERAYHHERTAQGGYSPLSIDEMKKHLYFKGRNAPLPMENSKECAIDNIEYDASRFLLINGSAYQRCGEPVYCIYTFGLGHNHASTHLSVDRCYNSNISHHRYFNALQRSEAVAEAKRIALARGDTNSIDSIGDYDITVLDETCVKCNPAKEHSDGNSFMNILEEITGTASSVNEAAVLTVLTTLSEITKGN